jgi:hypothetical protein
MLLPANGLLRHVYCDLQDESARITRFFPNRFAKDSLLAASISAVAGVIEAERQREAAPVRKAPPVLLLRCWQEGRLLFEEPLASVPAATRKNARLSVTDRTGQSLHAIEMAGATCLVRSTPAEEYCGDGGKER